MYVEAKLAPIHSISVCRAGLVRVHQMSLKSQYIYQISSKSNLQQYIVGVPGIYKAKHTNSKADASHPMNQHRDTVAGGQLPPCDPHEKSRSSSRKKHLQVLVEPRAGQCCYWQGCGTRARTTIERVRDTTLRGCSRVSAGPVRRRPRRWGWWNSLMSHITYFLFSPSTELVLAGRVHLAARLLLFTSRRPRQKSDKNATRTN